MTEPSKGWCTVCGASGRCEHCHWCTRTQAEGHHRFCPAELETYPAPPDSVCFHCETRLAVFRLTPSDPPRDEEGNEVWDMVCPVCAMKAEGG